MEIGIKQATEKGYIELQVPGICDLSYPSSKLRRGRVQGGGQDKSYDYDIRFSMQGNQMEKRIITIGGIGNTERQNRDNARVLGGGGMIYTLKSHISVDRPLVLKKWKKQK